MDADAPILCKLCGGLLQFIVRVSLPRQGLFQCDGCREFSWVADGPDDPGKDKRD